MSAGDDRILHGMLTQGRKEEPGPNWQGAAKGALNYARELGDDRWELWVAQAIVFAFHDVADAIRGGGSE